MLNFKSVPSSACEFRFIHSSGPGGQHVNKTATAVELRVEIEVLSLNAYASTTHAAGQAHQQGRHTRDTGEQSPVSTEESSRGLRSRRRLHQGGEGSRQNAHRHPTNAVFEAQKSRQKKETRLH